MVGMFALYVAMRPRQVVKKRFVSILRGVKRTMGLYPHRNLGTLRAVHNHWA
jgi:hypothetical protein